MKSYMSRRHEVLERAKWQFGAATVAGTNSVTESGLFLWRLVAGVCLVVG